MKKLIATLCLVACTTVRAEFTHQHLEPGQVYTNTMMLDLWGGMYERQDAFSAIISGDADGDSWPWFLPYVTATYQAYTGSTSAVSVVTNGAYVITNSLNYPVYVSTTLVDSANFYPFVFAGYTNVPHVTRAVAQTLSSWGYGVDDPEQQRWITTKYARHWEADGDGFFLDWLNSTNGPKIPSIANPGVILSYTNQGFVTNQQYDAWGSVSFSDWYWTRSPPTTQNWNLAEIYVGVTNVTGTNSAMWQFRANTPLDYHHYETNCPALLFSTGGDETALPAVDITISGYIFGGTGTPVVGEPTPQLTTNATEVVTLTTNRYALTKRWQSVTNITASTTLYSTGHTWSVVYDTRTVLYGDMDWTMTALDMNERRSVLDGLRWTYTEPGWQGLAGDPEWRNRGSLRYKWTGNSTNSWAEAQANAVADTPSTGSAEHVARQYTTGSYDGSTWVAEMWASTAKRKIYNGENRLDTISTNMYFELDVYAKVDAPGYPFPAFDVYEHYSYGATWLESTGIWYAATVGITNAIVTTNRNEAVWFGYGGDPGWFGSTNQPTEWCAEPGVGEDTFKGYHLTGDYMYTVLKWDSTTNGFQYIRD